MARSADAWPGVLFIDIGRALYVGPAFTTELHAHHAVQICVGRRRFRMRRNTQSRWRSLEGAIVGSNEPHQLEAGGATMAIAYIEPEGHDGTRLTALPAASVRAIRSVLSAIEARPRPSGSIVRLYDELREAFRLGTSPRRELDPRIHEALTTKFDTGEPTPPSTEMAARVGLSSTRFRHLFKEELGISYRRWVLWRKLHAAALQLAKGGSLTVAAHEAGFSDSAHLTRTFRRMFGIAPSLIPSEVWAFPTQLRGEGEPSAAPGA